MSINSKKIILAAGGQREQYWFSIVSGTGTESGHGIDVDSENNIIAVGRTSSSGAGGNDLLAIKYSPSGDVLWAKAIGGSNNDEGLGVSVDSSNNIFISGQYEDSSDRVWLVKLNSSGSLLFSKILAGGLSNIGRGVAATSAGGAVLVGGATGSGGTAIVTASYASNGSLTWQRTLDGSQNDAARDVSIDSSGNIYVAGNYDTSARNDESILAKYNSSGTLQWQRTLSTSGGSEVFHSVATDSSGNAVVTCNSSVLLSEVVAKYNSSGTLLWQKSISRSSETFFTLVGVGVDSASNIIVCGRTGAGKLLIFKLNSSGSLVWSKGFSTGGSVLPYSNYVAVDSSDNIVVCGNSGGNLFVAKVPSDGSGDGTYGSVVYGDEAVSVTNSSFDDRSGGTSGATSSYADGTASVSSTNAVISESRTLITP